MKYNQKLPVKIEKDLDAYIERIKNIKWFKPVADLKREKVDNAVKAALSAFGVEASIEYRSLKTEADYDAAWDAARDAAWDAAWGAARGAAWGAARDAAWGAARDAAWGAARDAAWGAARDAAWGAARGAADILATHTDTYKLKTPFVRLIDIWEMGMYPCGVSDGKFVVYSPMDFEEDKKVEVVETLPEKLVINGATYLRDKLSKNA